ncbi:MAG: TonB-dependent receptor [Phenylobacterium sp.]
MRGIQRALLCGSSALAICAATSIPAFAADADASKVEEVVVTGIRGSLKESLAMKRINPLVTDNISTSDIGQLPDVTIAEELNRLPGVNTTRDRGNASQASVRGLGPRLVFGLVNGREVASSEPSQDLRWEVYPSEVLGGVQVYKSQSAELIPGGIAATIDIRTIRALEYTGPKFSIRGGPTWNDEAATLPSYDPWGYRGSAGYFAHLTDDLAIGLAVSYQQEKNGFPDFRTFGWNTAANSGGHNGDLNGGGVDDTTWGLVTEVKEVVQDRAAISGTVGWRPTPNLEINADALYSRYVINEDQAQTWYGNNFMGNWDNSSFGQYNCPTCSYQIVDGAVVSGNLPNSFPNYQSALARYHEVHSLLVTGVNAKWTSGDWEAKLDASYSEAARNNRWQALYLETQYAPNLIFDVRDGHAPSASLPGFNPLAVVAAMPGNDPSFNGRDGQSDGPAHTKDHVAAVTFDVSRKLEGSFLTSFDFGARASDREKTYSAYRFNLCAGSTTPGFCDANAHTVDLSGQGLSAFNVHGFNAPPVVWGDWDKLFPLVYPNTAVLPSSELIGSRSDTSETTAEAYAKVNFATDGAWPMTGSLGLRVAKVASQSDGFLTTNGGASFTPISIKHDYTNWLPSLNLNFQISEDQVLRVGAAVAISRPPLDALVASFSLNPIVIGQPNTGGGGNPTLDPYKASQLDVSYEWYFHEESLFAAAFYYKHLSDFIGASSSVQTISGVQYIIGSENNGKGGDIEGLELTYQTRLYFLPEMFHNFGVYTNYAFVTSNIHEFAPAADPYTMVGLAKHTGEFDVWYNNGPLEARVALKYHSAFTVAPTWTGTTLKELAAETTLGASVSYQFNDHFSMRLQGNNLTNERARFSSDNNPQHLSNDGGYQVYGRSFLLDFAYKY